MRAGALGPGGGLPPRQSNPAADGSSHAESPVGGLERIADVPIYSTDALVRRSTPLQLTADARPPVADVPRALWDRLGLAAGMSVRVSQDAAQVELPVRLDTTLADGAVRVPAGHPATAALTAMFGSITVEKA